MLAAGSAIDPYWNLYAVHKNEEVYQILEQYKIGSLALDSRVIIELVLILKLEKRTWLLTVMLNVLFISSH